MRRICDERGALHDPRRGAGRPRADGARSGPSSTSSVVPDMLVVGKGLSGGVYPMAALLLRRAGRKPLRDGPLLPPIELRRLGARRAGRGGGRSRATRTRAPGPRLARWASGLRRAWTSSWRARPDRLAGHRGLGLMRALDTRSDAIGLELTKQCFAHGLLAIFAFNRQSTLQVMPPLVIIGGGGRRSARAARCGRRCVVTVAGLAGPTD